MSLRSRIRGGRCCLTDRVSTAAQFLTLRLIPIGSTHMGCADSDGPGHAPRYLYVRLKSVSNTNYCCLRCRKNYRRSVIAREIKYRCPICRDILIHAGMDFKAPKTVDIKAWKVVAEYLNQGHIYYRYYVKPGRQEYWSRKQTIQRTDELARNSVFRMPKRKRAYGTMLNNSP